MIDRYLTKLELWVNKHPYLTIGIIILLCMLGNN